MRLQTSSVRGCAILFGHWGSHQPVYGMVARDGAVGSVGAFEMLALWGALVGRPGGCDGSRWGDHGRPSRSVYWLATPSTAAVGCHPLQDSTQRGCLTLLLPEPMSQKKCILLKVNASDRLHSMLMLTNTGCPLQLTVPWWEVSAGIKWRTCSLLGEIILYNDTWSVYLSSIESIW